MKSARRRLLGSNKAAPKPQCRGRDSVESEPRDPDHVMKGTGERAENDLQQRTSEAGSASVASCALARAQRRRNEDDQGGAYTTESLEGGNTQYAIDLGLGFPSYADRKPKYDLLELGKQINGRSNQKGVLQRRQAGLREREKESHCCFGHGRLGDKQGVLHCMEAAGEKLAWRVVSGHYQQPVASQ